MSATPRVEQKIWIDTDRTKMNAGGGELSFGALADGRAWLAVLRVCAEGRTQPRWRRKRVRAALLCRTALVTSIFSPAFDGASFIYVVGSFAYLLAHSRHRPHQGLTFVRIRVLNGILVDLLVPEAAWHLLPPAFLDHCASGAEGKTCYLASDKAWRHAQERRWDAGALATC
ncbi:hypothetical protein B0H19DRAFT_1374164 [Mycena capillaripes]|nr:hypothetical protein B0H19DRAFT_1374164 [Mycena capillaripes]